MYNGIEIEHPVFRVLFCNLVAALLSSAVNVIVFPIKMEIKYSSIIGGNNVFCLIFHCCCWFIVSLLRYLYIIHKEWLLNRYPDPKYLNRLAIASVFLTYFTCWSTLIVVFTYCGWPKLKLSEMERPQKAFASGTLLGIFISLSCFLYLLILKKRGMLKNNRVGNIISKEDASNSAFEMAANQLGNVWTGNSQAIDDQIQHSTLEEV